MSKVIKIKKGLDINLKGKAEKIFIKTDMSGSYCLKPTDFKGIVPKLAVKPEDTVLAGTPLFYDKKNPDVLFTSPVSGTVKDVIRGERRKILEVIVQPDDIIKYEQFEKGDAQSMGREKIVKNMLRSGTWPLIRQRPYGTIANPDDTPKSIFISAFDTAPLAPDHDFIVKDLAAEFQAGIHALSKLTEGSIHVNVNGDFPVSNVYSSARGITINKFSGPHPAGNVGIQINKIDPLNKGDIVWYLYPQDVITIGRLFLEGKYDASKTIALAGSEVLKPRYYKVISGTCIKDIVHDNVTEKHNRFISGNVLTGTKITSHGYIGYYDTQVTIIPEGEHSEFLGWALPGFKKYSFSRAFFSWLFSDKEYAVDTNLHGGKRAFVVTGQYEKVLPMNIYPMQLLKAIMIEDIDMMEKLGIYEVIEEDLALCEFICPSKIEIQSVVRDGIDLMIKELG